MFGCLAWTSDHRSSDETDHFSLSWAAVSGRGNSGTGKRRSNGQLRSRQNLNRETRVRASRAVLPSMGQTDSGWVVCRKWKPHREEGFETSNNRALSDFGWNLKFWRQLSLRFWASLFDWARFSRYALSDSPNFIWRVWTLNKPWRVWYDFSETNPRDIFSFTKYLVLFLVKCLKAC